MSPHMLPWVMLLVLTQLRVVSGIVYRAAAVQASPIGTRSFTRATATQNLARSLQEFDQYARAAADLGANILVFPELVLYEYDLPSFWQGRSTEDFGNPRQLLHDYAEEVPDRLGSNLCTDERSASSAPIQTFASCAAHRGNLTVVINMLSIKTCTVTRPVETSICQDGYFILNTNLVYGANGAHIATHYKSHVAETYPFIDQPAASDTVSFRSDFGVTFGLFTCFDIMFRKLIDHLLNQGVTDFIYPTYYAGSMEQNESDATAWMSGFSRDAAANLIAANGNMWGGGIFSLGDPVNVRYMVRDLAPSAMLVADVGSGNDYGSGKLVDTVLLDRRQDSSESLSPMYIPMEASIFDTSGIAATRSADIADTADKISFAPLKGVPIQLVARSPAFSCKLHATASEPRASRYILRAESLDLGGDCAPFPTMHSPGYKGCSPDGMTVFMCSLTLALGSERTDFEMLQLDIKRLSGPQLDYFYPSLRTGLAKIAQRRAFDFNKSHTGAHFVIRGPSYGGLHSVFLPGGDYEYKHTDSVPNALSNKSLRR